MRNERQRGRRTFGERLASCHGLVRGMVAGAAITGYCVGKAKAHVVPAMQAASLKVAEFVPEELRLTSQAYRSAVELGYDEEKVRMAERAARRAWAEAKAVIRHTFGA